MNNARHRMGTLVPLVLAVLSSACVTRPLALPEGETSKSAPVTYPLSPEKQIDLLFVIDNSESMKQEQENLSRQFAALIDALRTPKLGGEGCSAENLSRCDIPDIRIGVISSDLGTGSYNVCSTLGGDGGQLLSAAQGQDCPTPSEPWIAYNEGQTNLSSSSGDPIQDVKDAFGCIASLGIKGCGFEQPLEAARRALDPDPELQLNPGFLRPEAYLAVVLITDEDDCSARNLQLFDPSQDSLASTLGPLSSFRCFELGITCDIGGRQPGERRSCRPGGDYLHRVEDYARFFASLKPEGRLILFAIAGPTQTLPQLSAELQPTAKVGLRGGTEPDLEPSCTSAMGKGVPAIRIQALMEHELLSERGQRGFFNGISRQQRRTGAKETVSICSADFAPALAQLGELITTVSEGCLSSPPLSAGGGAACQLGEDLGDGQLCLQSCLAQADCIVDELQNHGTSQEKRLPVDRCPEPLFDPLVEAEACGDHCPCWRLVRKESCAKSGGPPYALEIMRAGEVPRGSWAVSECSVSPYPWGSERFWALGQCQ